MDKTIKMAVSIDYKTLEGNFGKKFGKVGARPSRLIHFGKSGRVNEATIDEQLEKASSLNILLGVLVTWNSRYLEKVQKKVKDEEWYDEESFKRISPLGTKHVNFLGKYVFNEDKVKTEDGLRDLYIKR